MSNSIKSNLISKRFHLTGCVSRIWSPLLAATIRLIIKCILIITGRERGWKEFWDGLPLGYHFFYSFMDSSLFIVSETKPLKKTAFHIFPRTLKVTKEPRYTLFDSPITESALNTFEQT